MSQYDFLISLLFCFTVTCALEKQASTGTEFVVTEIADIFPGGRSNPTGYFEFDKQLFFAATGPLGRGLYKTDGFNVSLLDEIQLDGDASPEQFTNFNGQLFFSANGPHGNELYSTNGEAVKLVADVFPGLNGSVPQDFTVFNGSLYFTGADSEGRGLYSTDGETVRKPLTGNPLEYSNPKNLYVFNNNLYFTADGANGRGFYKTDGQNAVLVKDFVPFQFHIPQKMYTEFNDDLYFVGSNSRQISLFKTDGFNTLKVDSSTFSAPFVAGILGNELYYVDPDDNETLLKKTNGKTYIDSVAIVGDSFGDPRAYTVFGDSLYFQASGPAGAAELHKTNGEFVKQVTDISPGIHPTLFSSFMGFEDELYFNTRDVFHERSAIYKTDGSTVTLVSDNATAVFGGTFGSALLIGINGNLYSTIGDDMDLISEDIHGGGFTRLNGELIFTGEGTSGRELYKLTLSGDTDRDGDVDFADFTVVGSRFGKQGIWEDGDFNLNGMVDFSDFTVLAKNFGVALATEAPVSVPEPNSVTLLLILGLASLHEVGKPRPNVARVHTTTKNMWHGFLVFVHPSLCATPSKESK